jgi:hypothetical protein
MENIEKTDVVSNMFQELHLLALDAVQQTIPEHMMTLLSFHFSEYFI